MKFAEFILLLLEKGLIRNSFGLRTYLEVYQKYIDLDLVADKKPEQQQQQDIR